MVVFKIQVYKLLNSSGWKLKVWLFPCHSDHEIWSRSSKMVWWYEAQERLSSITKGLKELTETVSQRERERGGKERERERTSLRFLLSWESFICLPLTEVPSDQRMLVFPVIFCLVPKKQQQTVLIPCTNEKRERKKRQTQKKKKKRQCSLSLAVPSSTVHLGYNHKSINRRVLTVSQHPADLLSLVRSG